MSTIRDVALYAGVSTATVSRVINRIPNVKPETVEKVNEAIKACNFVPNFVARNLKSEQSRTIGFLVPDISNTYFTVMAKTLEAKLQEAGYDLLICSTDDVPAQEAHYLNQMLSNQVVGLILDTTGKNNPMIEDISQRIPFVLIERSIDSICYHGDFVGANNHNGIYELTIYLLEKGHRKIAVINGNLEVSTGRERYQGFVDAMSSFGIVVDEQYPYVYNANSFLEKAGYEGAQYLMNISEPPSAVIVMNNSLSLGALKYLKNQKIRIPEDVSIMCYGNIENSELFFVEPAYTTLNPRTIADKIFQYILTRIENPELNNRETFYESRLYLGESVGPYHKI